MAGAVDDQPQRIKRPERHAQLRLREHVEDSRQRAKDKIGFVAGRGVSREAHANNLRAIEEGGTRGCWFLHIVKFRRATTGAAARGLMFDLAMNRPADACKLIARGLGAIRVNLRSAERLLQEAILALRQGYDYLLLFFLFFHSFDV